MLKAETKWVLDRLIVWMSLAIIIGDKSPFYSVFFWRQLFKSILALLLLVSPSFSAGNVPRSVNLFFTNDEYGPAAEYYLTAQVTNRTGRPAIGVSALFFDGGKNYWAILSWTV